MYQELPSNLYSLDFRNNISPNDLIKHKGNKVSYSVNDKNSNSFNEVEASSHKSIRSAEGDKGKSSIRLLREETGGKGQHADSQKKQNTNQHHFC